MALLTDGISTMNDARVDSVNDVDNFQGYLTVQLYQTYTEQAVHS